MIDIDDIASGGDLGNLIGFRQNVINNWRRRYPDFPQPFTVVANGTTPLFRKSEFIEWYRQRLSPEMREALR